ncbi:MAG: PEP-CTERM sorting domain-containing protein [Gemmatimonadales bacterium]|nr:PEP-CTERM sorting domain-containing protein [Gemmatimonadales bacterium]
MNKSGRTAALLLAASIAAGGTQAAAQAVRTDIGYTTGTVPRNDDSFVGPVSIGFTVNFFGVTGSTLFVNNNGNITFNSGLSTFTPFNLTSTATNIIAPFFADVDTRAAGSALVTYGNSAVNGRAAFGVNWVNVGYFSSHDQHLNSFQLIMIDRSDLAAGDFDFEFNYDRITWESGQASGSDANGLGGSSARAGFSNGTGAPNTSFELPGSAVNGAFLDGGPNALISHRLNSNLDGRYIFTVRNGQVIVDPGVPDTTVPEPETYLLLATGLVGIVVARKFTS